MNRWTLLRAGIVVVVVGLLASVEVNVRGQSAQLRALDAKITGLEKKLHDAGEARRMQPLVASADGPRAAKASAHDPAKRSGESKKAPTAGARAKTKGSAFASLLDHLYDAADQLAEEEDWQPETYDRVTEIFEWTASEMLALQQKVQSKEMNVTDAKKGAVRIRDEASEQLGEVLGPDAMARLKQAWMDDRAK